MNVQREMFWFNLNGFLYCLFTGNLGKLSALRAQAKLEAGVGLPSETMLRAKNLWGMQMPTPYATGTVPDVGEPLAMFPSWWTSWKARLKWDERKGVNAALQGREWTLREYMTTVVAKGYNPSNDYVDAWAAVWEQETSWFGKLLSPDLETNLGWKPILINVVIILVIGFVLWRLGKKVWKWFDRKVNKRFK